MFVLAVMALGYAAIFSVSLFVLVLKVSFDNTTLVGRQQGIVGGLILIPLWSAFYSYCILHSYSLSSNLDIAEVVTRTPLASNAFLYFLIVIASKYLGSFLEPEGRKWYFLRPVMFVLGSFASLFAIGESARIAAALQNLSEFVTSPVAWYFGLATQISNSWNVAFYLSENSLVIAFLGMGLAWALSFFQKIGDSERSVIRTYRLAVHSGIWLVMAIAVTGGLIWLLDGGGLGQYASGPPASGPDVR